MQYKLTKKGALKVIGIRRTTPYGGGTCAVIKSDPQYLQQIASICGKAYDLGLCFGFLEDRSNDYMCAVEYSGPVIPEPDCYSYAPCSWLEFEVRGKISENVLGEIWNRIHTRFLLPSQYRTCAPTSSAMSFGIQKQICVMLIS